MTTRKTSIRWGRIAMICAPAALLLGACAAPPPPPPNTTAEQALEAAQRAQQTANEALAIAKSSRAASSEMYQRSLRK